LHFAACAHLGALCCVAAQAFLIAAVVLLIGGALLWHNAVVALWLVQLCSRIPTWLCSGACCACSGPARQESLRRYASRRASGESAPAEFPAAPQSPRPPSPSNRSETSTTFGDEDAAERGDALRELGPLARAHTVSDMSDAASAAGALLHGRPRHMGKSASTRSSAFSSGAPGGDGDALASPQRAATH
jgi:hypothetical protein